MTTVEEKVHNTNHEGFDKTLFLAIVNEKKSVLNDYNLESFYRRMLNDLKCDNGMLSFLLKLLDEPDDRYIKLPHYRSTTKPKLKDNEICIDDNGKYGILLNLVSNRKSFNFSIRLKDMTIIKYNYELRKQERGSFRSFTLTDKYGNISDNWKILKVFQMHETKKIFDNHDKHDIIQHNIFISDQLSQKLLSIKYFLLKCYINRLVMERDYWKDLLEKADERIRNFDYKYEMTRLKEECDSFNNGDYQ